jgi:hypothetical protein
MSSRTSTEVNSMGKSQAIENASAEDSGGAFGVRETLRLGWRVLRARGPLIASGGAIFFWLGQFAGAMQKGEKVLRADAVVADRFEIVRGDGTTAALLHTDDHESTMLTFYDAKQKARLSIGFASLGQPGITVYDAKGALKMSLRLDADGYPIVDLIGDAPFGPRAYLLATKDSTSVSVWSEKSGKAWMGLDGTGQPGLRLTGAEKERRLSLTTADPAGPMITLTGKDQGIDVTAGSLGLGAGPKISLKGKNNLRRIEWTLPPDLPPAVLVADEMGNFRLIMTLDKDGKPTWRQFAP